MLRDLEASVIGGGLAGCEAAWQLLRRGCRVTLFEMKPERYSPAHTSPDLAELVCSNSLRSADPASAAGLLKEEMRRLDSLFMKAADMTSVPAGKSLAVDRQRFSAFIQESLLGFGSQFQLIHREITGLPDDQPTILATGPLTSDLLAVALQQLTGKEYLYFYDAIAPIVMADSVDPGKTFWASRYDYERDAGAGDYLNCSLTEEEYTAFREALLGAANSPCEISRIPVISKAACPWRCLRNVGSGPSCSDR